MKIDGDQLLELVTAEEEISIGFDLDAELQGQMEAALRYYKGYMDDLPAMENRSQAVSMDVRDVIQAMLPDIVEAIVGDEEAVAFRPTGPEDEEGAEQETDALRFVLFQENEGWKIVATAVLDSFQAKIGVFKWWPEEGDQPEDEKFEGKTAAEVELASQYGEIIDLKPCDDEAETALAGEQLYDFKVRYPQEDGRVRIGNIPPEDITVARDTVRLRDATYCAIRVRPRAQDLIKDGIDPELVEMLPPWTQNGEGLVQIARDTVDETTMVAGANPRWQMRRVEVKEHYIRLKDKKGEKLYCVLTGGEGASAVLLRWEEVNSIPIAAFSPYMVTHHFYGNSVADFVIDIQRIKSQMQRMTLDSGYFALNQRHEVSEQRASEDTIDDLLRNEPGVPVRSRTGDAVRPIPSPGLGFDALTHLEYFSTVLEERTGLVRGAQGLNPDALHDTKGGMMAQLARSQKRVRMVLKTIVEMGIKDLYLGVHAMMRQTASKARMMRLRGKWVEINPSQWAERADMTIDIGVGAGGRDYEIAMAREIIGIQAQAVQAQGGIDGPLVTAENLYNAATYLAKKMGVKAPDRFFSNPAEQPPKPPQPDPEMAKVEAQAKLEEQKLQIDTQKSIAEMQQERQKLEAKFALETEARQADIETKRAMLEAEMDLKRQQMIAEIDLKREQMAAEMALKREQMVLEAAMQGQADESGDIPESSDVGDVEIGGEPG